MRSLYGGSRSCVIITRASTTVPARVRRGRDNAASGVGVGAAGRSRTARRLRGNLEFGDGDASRTAAAVEGQTVFHARRSGRLGTASGAEQRRAATSTRR